MMHVATMYVHVAMSTVSDALSNILTDVVHMESATSADISITESGFMLVLYNYCGGVFGRSPLTNVISTFVTFHQEKCKLGEIHLQLGNLR